jgi:hypothetical protein
VLAKSCNITIFLDLLVLNQAARVSLAVQRFASWRVWRRAFTLCMAFAAGMRLPVRGSQAMRSAVAAPMRWRRAKGKATNAQYKAGICCRVPLWRMEGERRADESYNATKTCGDHRLTIRVDCETSMS